MVAKKHLRGYNKANIYKELIKYLGWPITPVYFEPTLSVWESYYLDLDDKPPLSGHQKNRCGHPPSYGLGVRKQEPASWIFNELVI